MNRFESPSPVLSPSPSLRRTRLCCICNMKLSTLSPFMGTEHLPKSDVSSDHEPFSIVSFISNELRVRFMASEHLQNPDVSWSHEPVAADVRRRTALGSASLRRRLRSRGSWKLPRHFGR